MTARYKREVLEEREIKNARHGAKVVGPFPCLRVGGGEQCRGKCRARKG